MRAVTVLSAILLTMVAACDRQPTAIAPSPSATPSAQPVVSQSPAKPLPAAQIPVAAGSTTGDFETALRALPPLPTLPTDVTTDLQRQLFVQKYEDWVAACDVWKGSFKGATLQRNVKLYNAELSETVRGGKNLTVTFDAVDRSPRLVIQVEWNATTDKIEYWSKIKQGTAYTIRGNVSHISVFGPLSGSRKVWQYSPSLYWDADKDPPHLWITLDKVTFPQK